MKKLKLDLLIALVIAAIFSLLFYFNVLSDIDYLIGDYLYQRPRMVTSDIVIVGIDDQSLSELGRWPWNRSIHGRVLEHIDKGGPKAIGMDVLLLEEAKEDATFIESLSKLSQKPVLACYASLDDYAEKGRIEARELNKPIASLLPYVDLAHINTLPDDDGMVRRTVLGIGDRGEEIPSFARLIFKKAFLREQSLAPDSWSRAFIRYAGRASSFEILPYYMVENAEIESEYFRDKIVLIGVTAIGLADDYYFTPIDRSYPMYGIEVHANIIAQMMEGLSWERLPELFEIALIFLLSLLSILTFRRLRLSYGIFSLLCFIALYILLADLLSMQERGYILSLIYPLASLVLVFVVYNLARYIQESLEKKRVTAVFTKYMEPRLVNKLLEGGQAALSLGGEKKLISILFVDIRGFTTMSEHLEPSEVVNILNEYLNLCAEAIFKYEGVLDKYIGDAAMALFGSLLDDEDHAFKAVQTALYMQKGASELSKRLEEKYGRSVSFGVGVNTGYAIVGNIGASHRLDYTAIGDAVNTAARLESNAKAGQILISKSTFERVETRIEVRSMGPLKVKGKEAEIEVFEVMGLKEMG